MELSACVFERVTKTTYGHQKRFNHIVFVETMDHIPSGKGITSYKMQRAIPIKLVASEIGNIHVKHKVSLSYIDSSAFCQITSIFEFVSQGFPRGRNPERRDTNSWEVINFRCIHGIYLDGTCAKHNSEKNRILVRLRP